MAPPSTKPKLSDVDPKALAIELVGKLLGHLQAQLFHVSGPACDLMVARLGESKPLDPSPEYLLSTQLGFAIRTLAGYARGDHGLDAPVREYLISLLPLWSSAMGSAEVGEIVEEAPSSELAIVMQAAQCREDIGSGVPVSLSRLAALASVSPRTVQALVASEELPAKNGRVAAKDAKRWLAARGVPGFARKAREA